MQKFETKQSVSQPGKGYSNKSPERRLKKQIQTIISYYKILTTVFKEGI